VNLPFVPCYLLINCVFVYRYVLRFICVNVCTVTLTFYRSNKYIYYISCAMNNMDLVEEIVRVVQCVPNSRQDRYERDGTETESFVPVPIFS